mmetsp:Transcript_32529/g.52737  ORF Transcript_32529/g.52737 Transcript_32529/m.52737 type:complete len:202 (+) Transcript_32529:1177-1782(+)
MHLNARHILAMNAVRKQWHRIALRECCARLAVALAVLTAAAASAVMFGEVPQPNGTIARRAQHPIVVDMRHARDIACVCFVHGRLNIFDEADIVARGGEDGEYIVESAAGHMTRVGRVLQCHNELSVEWVGGTLIASVGVPKNEFSVATHRHQLIVIVAIPVTTVHFVAVSTQLLVLRQMTLEHGQIFVVFIVVVVAVVVV